MSQVELPPCNSPAPSTRIAGHRLVSLPDEPIRVWQTLTTTTCRAPVHDTLAARKNHGCLCPTACRTGRPRLIDAAPTTRLLQALAALGWSSTDLAGRLQLNPVSVSSIRRGAQDKVTPATARAVGAVYRELKTTPGPSQRTATFARQHGWPPPRLAGEVHRTRTTTDNNDRQEASA